MSSTDFMKTRELD